LHPAESEELAGKTVCFTWRYGVPAASGIAVALCRNGKQQLPFRITAEGAPPMTQPTTKIRRPLVHHPSDVLDDLCQYDAANRRWRKFDESLSHQLLALEYEQRKYIRVQNYDRRRSM
jgi:hypothetical protein